MEMIESSNIMRLVLPSGLKLLQNNKHSPTVTYKKTYRRSGIPVSTAYFSISKDH